MHRRSVSKRSSAGKFRGRAAKTHQVNTSLPKRGGIRL